VAGGAPLMRVGLVCGMVCGPCASIVTMVPELTFAHIWRLSGVGCAVSQTKAGTR